MRFKLFSNCKIVKGASRSVLCDLQTEQYIFLPNELVELFNDDVLNLEEIKPQMDDEDYKELIKFKDYLLTNDYIFEYEQGMEGMFPQLPDQFHFPGEISNAIIEVSEKNITQLFEYDVFQQLLYLGCRNIEIRILDFQLIKRLIFILKETLFNEFLSIDIFIQKQQVNHSFKSTQRFLKNHRNIRSLVIFNEDRTQIISSKFRGFGGFALVKGNLDSSNCGTISPDYFNKNIQVYTESLKHNTCLNKKISIDKNGLIKNCPSCSFDFGSIETQKLSDIVIKNKEFRKYFDIHKDQVKVCRDCEFRRICTDCRIFISDEKDIYSKPLKCSYNPYTASWL